MCRRGDLRIYSIGQVMYSARARVQSRQIRECLKAIFVAGRGRLLDANQLRKVTRERERERRTPDRVNTIEEYEKDMNDSCSYEEEAGRDGVRPLVDLGLFMRFRVIRQHRQRRQRVRLPAGRGQYRQHVQE